LLRETLDVARRGKHVTDHELSHVNVDTTVQEKNITHPTDSKLLLRAITKLVAAAKDRGLPLRQSYVRVAKRAAIKASQYAHARQFKRMRREVRFPRTRLGRLIRDIERKLEKPDEELATLLALADRLRTQQRTDKNKLYSLHEPETCCISKGKARKRYEFGQKVAVATTNRGNWFVASELMAGNPYDGHTLAATLDAVETNTGVGVKHAYVDRGYRGHRYPGPAAVEITGSGGKRLTRTQKRRRKRRAAVEPKIGHAKSDHRMGRCFLKGLEGDAINATLAAAGANLLKLLRLLRCALGLSSSMPPAWLQSALRTILQTFRTQPHPIHTAA
jgi:IS5 family transposase